jgi:hypothetical protein
MKVIYKGKKCKVVGIVVHKSDFVAKPMILQVTIQWKEDGDICEDTVSANEVEFISGLILF